tara:strand:- start:255 stop:602 length:348 start_codon:yes stop_codon:yes gene_type:complete
MFLFSCAGYELPVPEPEMSYRWEIVGYDKVQFKNYDRCISFAKQLFPKNPNCMSVPYDGDNNKEGTTTKQTAVYWELVTTTHGAVGRFSSSQACYSQLALLTKQKIKGTCYKRTN